jgi:hypothetical protein
MSSKFLISASSQVEISDVVGLQDELDEIEAQIAGGGGGGGISYDAGSVVQGNGLNFRNGGDADKIKNAAGFALINLIGIGDSLLVNDIQFPSIYSAETTINQNKTDLTKITYDTTDPLKPFTKIEGELDVDKIKNTGHTAEIEFENTGKLLLKCDDEITMKAPKFSFIDSDDDPVASGGGITFAYDSISQGRYEIKNTITYSGGQTTTDQGISMRDVFQLYGIKTTSTIPPYIEFNLGGLKIVAPGFMNTITIETNGGTFRTNTTPTFYNCVTTKQYVDSQGFSPVPLSICDYLVPTQTSQYYYTTQATHNLTLNNMSIYTNGSSTGDVWVAVYRGELGALPRPERIAYGTINTNGGVIRSATLTPGNVSIIKGEALTIGLYATTSNVDLLAFYGNLSNNFISAYTATNITTDTKLPENPPVGMSGSSYGNVRFGCMLY